MSKGEKIAHLKLNIPGEHNILNSLAAFAAAKNAGCTNEECEKGIAAFGGAGRRFEVLGEFDGITIACMVHELSEKLVGGRITKISQPEKEEVLLTVKSLAGQHRLFISASASLQP